MGIPYLRNWIYHFNIFCMNLPTQYQWLLNEGAPKMLVEFLKIYGVAEMQGPGDNPVILGWAKEVGLEHEYVHDITPWCGLEMAVIASRAGKEVVKGPLWALNWVNFGIKADEPMLGDVVIFKRPGEDETAYHVAGGNESDKSNIVRIAKDRLYAVRRPIYATGQPSNVRKVILSSTGSLSSDEK
jgi:uncharacterized protein (TIGR02594 family)